MLKANGLSLIRQSRVLFEHLSFSLNSGEAIWLEGKNGAGKTSLLRILAGLSQPDAGDVSWNGELLSVARESYHQNLLYLGHQGAVNRELTPVENLQFLCALHAPKSTEQIINTLQLVGLAGHEDVPAGHLSAGQQRRVALARLWLSDATLWILDEPFTALDMKAVAGLETKFLEHLDKGGMLLVTTHQHTALPEERITRLILDNYSGAKA